MDHATNPSPRILPPLSRIPPPLYVEQFSFVMPSFMKASQLSRQGLENAFYLLVLHVLLSAVARILPGFDPSGDFAYASYRTSFDIGVAACMVTIPVQLTCFAVPVYMRRKQCVAAASFVPANDLRKRLLPHAGARSAAVHVFVVLACVGGAYMVGSTGERRVIDPFHAGALAVFARGLYCAVRRYVFGDMKAEEVLLPEDYRRYHTML
ncbi:hypothetical protein C8Q80DRAFT_1211433 [Daedaleopsis nitida]|nr:hypothetical protein C8Q80DRAFT_1211433 [Daedaleopsis nitida]